MKSGVYPKEGVELLNEMVSDRFRGNTKGVRMKGWWPLALAVALTGCDATLSTHTVRGVSALHINCSGLTSSWDKCYEKAEQACGAPGYSVLSKTTDLKDDTPDYPFGINPAGLSSRALVIKCRQS